MVNIRLIATGVFWSKMTTSVLLPAKIWKYKMFAMSDSMPYGCRIVLFSLILYVVGGSSSKAIDLSSQDWFCLKEIAQRKANYIERTYSFWIKILINWTKIVTFCHNFFCKIQSTEENVCGNDKNFVSKIVNTTQKFGSNCWHSSQSYQENFKNLGGDFKRQLQCLLSHSVKYRF